MTADRIKLLILCSTMSGGGAERNVSTILHFLDRERFSLHLCLFRRDVSYPIPDDVPITVLDKYRPWDIPIAIVKLARLIDREKPDVIFSAFSHPNFIAGNALGLVRHRPKWVARIGSHPDLDEKGLLRLWMSVLYRRADMVLPNSEKLNRVFVGVYPSVKDRIHTVRNPKDFATMDEEAKRPIERDRPEVEYILSVGRMTEVKRIDLLLDTFASIQDRTEARLCICGSGPLLEKMRRQAERLGVAHRVQFAGFCENIFAWMARARIFVLTSDHEGSPTALIEAQGLGIPAISTDCPTGPGEIIEHGKTGLLVPTGDQEALADALLELLSNPERCDEMGAAAKQRTRRHFSAEKCVGQLSELLSEVARR